MRLSALAFLSISLVSFSKINGQAQADTLVSPKSPPHYEFHLSLKPQEGYGLILGFHGGIAESKPYRDIFELGIARTYYGHDAGTEIFASLEINDIERRPIYGFVVGADAKSFIDLGVSLNSMTDFSGRRAIFVRPHFGIILLPIVDLFGTFEYDAPLLTPNFNIVNRWMIGIRYDLGFLTRKKYSG